MSNRTWTVWTFAYANMKKHLEDETAFIIWTNINGTSFEYLSSSKNGNDAYASIQLRMYDVIIDQLINAYTDNINYDS